MSGTLGTQHNFGLVAHVARTLGERPDPRLERLGTKFTNETTGDDYVVVRDAAGNHVWIQTGGPSLPGINARLYKFSGNINSQVSVPSDAYLADTELDSASVIPIKYPVLADGKIDKTRIRMTVLVNTMTVPVVATIAKNGVDTGATVVIAPLSTVVPPFPADVAVAAGDTVDFHLSCGFDGNVNVLTCSADFDIVNP